MSCVLANRIILNVREINRDLELSKIPTSNQRSRGNHYGGPGATDSDIMEYYYDQAGTMSFGNNGTLTQFEMNQRPIDWQPVHIARPHAPEPDSPRPPSEPELLESPLDDDSDVDVPHDLPFKVL